MAGDGLPRSAAASRRLGVVALLRHQFWRAMRPVMLLAGAWLLVACNSSRTASALHTAGPASGQIALLWWILLGTATVVFVIVIVYLGLGLTRSFYANRDEADRLRIGARIVLIGGIIIPAAILLGVMVLGLTTLRALARPNIANESTIHVIGHQWWWEVRYPNAPSGEVVTANEIRIPTGQPMRVLLDSDDVIHSFWVPELHGKLDLVPGQTNETWIEADASGVYRGICAEFCGRQHAKMQFVVVAQPEEAYHAWLDAQAQPAQQSTDELAQRGFGIFMLKGCGNCHTIAGTAADGNIAPDLTHIASRLTLAAASMPNTRGHLAGWITDPQHNKPGAYMPPTNLSGDELEALLAYLASLK